VTIAAQPAVSPAALEPESLAASPVALEPEPLAASPAALEPEPASQRRTMRRRIAAGALSVLIVAAAFGFALPRIASYGGVWASLTAMSWPAVLLIAAAAVVSQLTTWMMIGAVLPSLRLREAAVMNLGSSAVANTVPAGGAVSMGVSWAMLASWGVGTAEFVRYTLVSGFWNVFIRLGLPVVALVLLVITGQSSAALQAAAYTGAVLLLIIAVGFRVMLRSERFAELIGRAISRVLAAGCALIRRQPPRGVPGLLLDFRAGASGLLAERGLRITVTTVASNLSLWLVLLACLRGSGLTQAQVSWEVSLAAFAFVRLLSVLPVTPGGIGVVELGLTGPLIAGLGPAAAARVAAAVLLYRAVTYLLPIPLGAAAYVWWRHTIRAGALIGSAGTATGWRKLCG
jgi:putative heme transporter